jgi:hypothetical protein
MSWVCLNQSSNSWYRTTCAGVTQVEQQIDLSRYLVARLDRNKARQHVPALEHAVARRDQRLVEMEVSRGRRAPKQFVDYWLAGVEIDRCARERERVYALRKQGRIDGCEPSALAVADQVRLSAAMLDCAIDGVQIVVDRCAGGCAGGSDQVERERAG